MNAKRWLLLANMALSFYGAGMIWLTQVTCYPLWAYVGPAEFHNYHIFWWHSIWGVCLFPTGLVVLASFAMLRWRPPGVPVRALWLGVGLQVAVWVLTALFWGRWQGQLEQVSGPVYGLLFHKLLITHWLRVAIITAYSILQFWMVSMSFRAAQRDAIVTPDSQQRAGMPMPAGSPSAGS